MTSRQLLTVFLCKTVIRLSFRPIIITCPPELRLGHFKAHRSRNWVCVLLTRVSIFRTPHDVPVLVWQSLWHNIAMKNIPILRFLAKNAVFWLAVSRFFQVEACFVFIGVWSSLHTSHNLNYKPQVPMWYRFKICPMCPFLAIFGLISHMILHRTTLTPVFA